MGKKIVAADLFCGAGGTSTGLALAAAELGAEIDLIAVNHWNIAVETHAANHPRAEHHCATLEGLEPWDVLGRGRRLDLLVASPECTHHSSARGGVPMSDQSRASAWHVIRWVEALKPRAVLIENVPEFETWGPLGSNGRPLKSKSGVTFRAWVEALRSLGYTVERRILNAADYGDATTRRRLFVVAVRGRFAPPFPSPTHAKDTAIRDLFAPAPLKPWRAAREIIDWGLPSRSIFGRERPLAESTLRRIEEGLRRFGGAAAEPFLAILRGTGSARDLDRPAPAITAGGGHLAFVEPLLVGQHSGGLARPTTQPSPTVAAKGAIALAEFIVPRYGERPGQRPRTHDVGEPMPLIPATNQHGLAQAFVVGQGGPTGSGRPRDVDDPLKTVLADARHSLVQPFVLAPLGRGRGNAPRAIDQPVPTITASRGGGTVVEPILVPYYGNGHARPTSVPVGTLTTRDRYALVEGSRLDIMLRMLQPHELSAAMSFPPDYKFSGTKGDVVRQIGNAVPVGVARALTGAIIRRAVERRAKKP